MFGATIEVIDNKGNVVEVKPVDIPAGDTTVFFEFVETQTEQEGVWKIAGHEYDFDLAAKLDAFVAAVGNQIALNEALADLGIENVKVENMKAYADAQQEFLDELEEDEAELTVEAIQAWIDEVNVDVAEAGDKKAAEAAAAKAVKDALKADNDIALQLALQNDVFVKVNDEWTMDYKTQFNWDTLIDADSDADDIQTQINAVNDGKVNDAIAAIVSGTTGFPTDAIDSVETKKLNTAKDYILNYATVDNDGEYVNANLDDALEAIEVQLAVADVLAATTPTTLKARLTALDNLEAFSTDFIKDNFIEANLKYYLNGFGDPATGGFKQVPSATVTYEVSDVETLITTMNTTVSTSYVTAVTSAGTADELLAALKAFPGLKYVADANKDVYWDATSVGTENQFASVTDDVTTQAKVVELSINAINAADKTKVIAALNVLELDDIIVANAEAYVADASASVYTDASPQTLAGATDRDEVQAAVDQINKAVVVAAQVDAINEADDVATVKAALDALADVDEVVNYLKIRSVDRDFVAAYVLENRPDGGYVAGTGTALDEIDAEVNDAQTAYDAALTAVNNIQIDSSIDTIVSALEGTLDEDYLALSNTAKVEAAEAFYEQLTFKTDGTLETPFVTLAAVKALL
jgi:hypothetical protein